jgi:hypothetical protein
VFTLICSKLEDFSGAAENSMSCLDANEQSENIPFNGATPVIFHEHLFWVSASEIKF